MMPARSSAARAERSAPEQGQRRHSQRPRVINGQGRGVRWDRLGRVALLIVAIVVIGLYVGPLSGLYETWGERGQRRQQLEGARLENRRLVREREALRDPSRLEREARRLGKVRPGERPYVVENLPK